VITFAVSSGVVCAWPAATGASFPTVTETVAAGEVKLPSFTVNVKLSGPEYVAFEVYVTCAVQLVPPPLGVQLGAPIEPSVPCVGAVPTANVSDALSISDPASVIVFATFFEAVTACPLAAGTSFTAVTVIETVAAGEGKLPSFVVNVKLSAPL
jgi:hypothetical protein